MRPAAVCSGGVFGSVPGNVSGEFGSLPEGGVGGASESGTGRMKQ